MPFYPHDPDEVIIDLPRTPWEEWGPQEKRLREALGDEGYKWLEKGAKNGI